MMKKPKEKEELPFICNFCGQRFAMPYEKASHVRICPNRPKEKEKEPTPPPSRVYREEPDANRILRYILSSHPDIPPKHVDEIMSWAKLKGQLHPMEVAHLLSSMRGISSQTATIIAQKYSVALQKEVAEGKAVISMPLAPTIGPTPPQLTFYGPYGVPQPTVFAPPSPPAVGWWPQVPSVTAPTVPTMPPTVPPKPLTEEDMKKAVASVFDEKVKPIEERLKAVEERIKKPPEEKVVALTVPVRDKEGKIVFDEKGEPVMQVVSGPESVVTRIAPREDVEERALRKFRMYRELMKPEITEETIRKIVKEEVPPKEKPLTKEEVKETVKEVIEAEKEKLTPEKVRQIIREEQKPAPVGEYKEDAYKLMATALQELADAVKSKKPVEVVLKEGRKFLGIPMKEVEPGAKETLEIKVPTEYIVEE